MDKKELIQRLESYPSRIANAEFEYLKTLREIETLKHELFEFESKLLLEGIKNEKSEKLREAALFPHTKLFHLKILQSEELRDEKKIIYHRIKKECEHLEYIVRLIN